MRRSLRRVAASFLLPLLIFAPAVYATWSIVAVDTATGEVAVASATCLGNFDLRAGLPVVRVEVGAAAAQSAIDNFSRNRKRIWDRLKLGWHPDDIVDFLSTVDGGHQGRQYGMVDLQGRSTTFTGSGARWWKGGLTGEVGTIRYAIQGNVLAGADVVNLAEDAFVNTAGDLGQKLMAAMEAARAMGGDGRCSCSELRPMSCGTPPPGDWKSSHIGFVIVARPGDTDGDCDGNPGCAQGDYYLNLNVAFQGQQQEEPVYQLQNMYDPWRAALVGRPDAVHSTVFPAGASAPAGSTTPISFVLDLADVDGAPLVNGGASVSLVHDATSAGLATLHRFTDHLDGTYTVEIMPGATAGHDRLRLVVDDGIRPVTLWPPVDFVNLDAPQPPLNDLSQLAGLDSAGQDRHAKVLSDGLTAYLLSNRNDKPKHLMRATRPAPDAPFGPAADVDGLNSYNGRFTGLWVSDDELCIVFSAQQGDSTIEELFEAKRDDAALPFEQPERIAELNSGFGDAGPWLSDDQTVIYFHSARPGGGGGGLDLWRAERFQSNGRFFPPEPITSLNTAADESYPMPAAADSRLYFSRTAANGNEDLCVSDRAPGLLFAPDDAVPGTAQRGRRMALTDIDRATGDYWLSLGVPTGVNDVSTATPTATSLGASADSLSAAAGGQIEFALDAGSEWAGAEYQLLLGGSGRVPATRLGNAVLPFRGDEVTALTLLQPNLAPFTGFAGTLDGAGTGTAQLTLQAGSVLKPGLLGRDYLAAFVARIGPMKFVSNAASFRLEP